MSSRIEEVPALDAELLHAVGELVRTAPDAGDNPPISEQGLLQLRASRPVRHLVAWAEPAGGTDEAGDGSDRQLVGYAQLDGATPVPAAELVADQPEAASELLDGLTELAGPSGFRIWAHGPASAANQAALRAGLAPQRTLLQLRRSLTDLAPAPGQLAEGVRIRAFQPGQDEARWLVVNQRAFADHPEQGGWTEQDLADRISAAWFDPAGFLLAERTGPSGDTELLGFHWTKVHPGTDQSPPIGEVYVLGVDPAAQGLRLGTSLLVAGLTHLREQGLDSVLLYVDEGNSAAVHLYARAGFTVFSTDIQYARR